MTIDFTEIDSVLSNMAQHLVPYKEPTEESWDSINGLYAALMWVLSKETTPENLPKLADRILDQVRFQHAAAVGQRIVYKQPISVDHEGFLTKCCAAFTFIECTLGNVGVDAFLASLK